MSIDKLILLTEKKLSLLRELKTSVAFEEAEYIAAHLPKGFDNNYYLLIKKDTETIKAEGSKERIQRYLDQRKITKVYWKHLI